MGEPYPDSIIWLLGVKKNEHKVSARQGIEGNVKKVPLCCSLIAVSSLRVIAEEPDSTTLSSLDSFAAGVAIILLFVLAIVVIYQWFQVEDAGRRSTRRTPRQTVRGRRRAQPQAEATSTRSADPGDAFGDQSSTPNGQVFSGQWARASNVYHDYYETLEVSPQAGLDVIKRVYRVLIEKYHPDKHPETRRSWAEEMTKNINEAFAVLSDERKRKEYNDQRAKHHSM